MNRVGRMVPALLLLALPFGVVAQRSASRPHTAMPSRQRPLSPSVRARILSEYAGLGFRFEPNVGQADRRFSFMARGANSMAYVGPTEMMLSVDRTARGASASSSGRRASVLDLSLEGANPRAPISGRMPLADTTNYLIGNDPARWRTNVPSFGSVLATGVYPGVDLILGGAAGGLEYTFRLAAGVDPGTILMNLRGPHSLHLDRRGDLILNLTGMTIVQPRPFVFQTAGGRRRPILGAYVLRDGGRVAFRVGPHDRALPLVIDPVLTYSTFLGGSANDVAIGVAVDASGDAFITGYTQSPNFPITPGAIQPTLQGGTDAYVTELNPSGSGLVFSTYLGGSADDTGESITVDPNGHAFVTGFTDSNNFPTTAGAVQRTFRGVEDAFLAELNRTGSALRYSTYLGGSGDDEGYAVTLDATASDVFVTGSTGSTDFPTTASAFQRAKHSGLDGFVAKVDPHPSQPLVYSTYLGGNGDDIPSGIALGDSFGRVFVTGLTSSSNFPTTSGAFQRAFRGGGFDAFMAKLNPPASGLNYSTYLGGSGNDQGVGIVVDSAGNAYLSGTTNSTNFPTTVGSFQPRNRGQYDAFVTKLNPNPGQPLVYSTYLGGTGLDFGYLLQLGDSGVVYVVGGTGSRDFPLVNPVQGAYGGAAYDAFLAEIASNGSSLAFSTYLGGGGHDIGVGVAVGPSGVYLVGDTNSRTFPTAGMPFQGSIGGGYDGFVAEITGTINPMTRGPADGGEGFDMLRPRR